MTSYAPAWSGEARGAPRLSQEWGGAARNEPPAVEAFPQLPDLADVARRLSAVQFVCVAACHVAKPPADAGALPQHAATHPADARVLAVGYCAGAPTAPELLKLSATPGFSLMRSWKSLVAGGPQHGGQRTAGVLRVTRRWPLADLTEVRLGPPGGGFVLHFRGGARDACFVPLAGADAAAAQLLSAAARAAAASGARLPRDTLAALAAATQRDAFAAPPPPPRPPPPQPLHRHPVPPSYTPRAPPPPPSPLPAAEHAALERALGASLPPELLAEHFAAEALLQQQRQQRQYSGNGSGSGSGSGSGGAPYTPPADVDDDGWETVPASILAPRATHLAAATAAPPPQQPQDVDALVERLLDDARQLRVHVEHGSARSPVAGRCAEACAAGCAALARLVAGHYGVAHWAPARKGAAPLLAQPAPQGRAALWVALHADVAALLAEAGRPLPGSDASSAAADAAGEGPLSGMSGMGVDSENDDDDGHPPPLARPPAPATPAVSLMDEPPPPPRSTNPFATGAPQQAQLIDLADEPSVAAPRRAAPPPPRAGQPSRAPSSGSRGDCCVCLERPVETALLSCGHAVACQQCASALAAANAGCPCCRRPISSIARIYL